MNITKASELMALHRAIVEAKFKESHFDSAIPYSGIVADLSSRILADIVHALQENGEHDEAIGWSSLIKLNEDWHGYECIKNWIRETRSWIDMDEEDKSQFIKVLCSPYQASKHQLNNLIKFGDTNWKV